MKLTIPTAGIAVLLASLNGCAITAFAPPMGDVRMPRRAPLPHINAGPMHVSASWTNPLPRTNRSRRSSLKASPLASVSAAAIAAARTVSAPSSILKAVLAFLAIVVAKNRNRIFYPGSLPDSSRAEPLPPGTVGGCPWIGSLGVFRDTNRYMSERAAKVVGGAKNPPPKIWKFFSFGHPVAVVSGSAAVKKLLSHEFKKEQGVSQMIDAGNKEMGEVLFGTESMSSETSDAKKYHLLQRLVGQALTPESVAKGMPFLQRCAEESVSEMLAQDTIVMNDLLHQFTLDVAWRQIIGLKLGSSEEISSFRSAVSTWMGALTNYFLYAIPTPKWVLKRLSSYKAKMYLNSKIEERINELEKNGPDGTTMSAMVYATDEEDGLTKLTRQQIIDNTCLLLLAGSETSSNTLTNAMFLLGMYPNIWDKLVKEQQGLVEKYGEDLTKDQIDNECPYLDGVVGETMRLIPISAGGIRKVDDTLILDGYQIPKGWMALYSPALTHEQDPKTFQEDGSHMNIRSGFKPERWMDSATRPTSEFIPFGAGHRFCLGHNLAMAEMKTFLAVMARKVRSFDLVSDADKMKWKEGIICTPKDGVIVSAHSK
uniref:Cytochrome P450 n=1 Tax=Trieres chinensis TaxID=1514140 RepID=A0A7S1ZR49_TRICV|mmetsp:Transcript_30802/g.62897  ORF Transcript_30802/g.62897 Transcript_30802/m.62897 type:complete len:596 (+) Transcript_30802:35-1822(+)